ncbi:MAG: hypothetical protein LRY67_00575, partial [Gammaproteobacteria bacterium]|nr:hypothetical protein [Gammaproteobacteria bacterium]
QTMMEKKEIFAFNLPYKLTPIRNQQNQSTTTNPVAASSIDSDVLDHHLPNTSSNAPLSIDEAIKILENPLTSSSFLLATLKKINPNDVREDNKAEVAQALLNCAQRIEQRRYRYYFLPREIFGYLAVPIFLYWLIETCLFYLYCKIYHLQYAKYLNKHCTWLNYKEFIRIIFESPGLIEYYKNVLPYAQVSNIRLYIFFLFLVFLSKYFIPYCFPNQFPSNYSSWDKNI